MTKPRFCPCRYGCASPGEKDQNGIDGTDPFPAKPDPGLITLLLRARRLNATLAHAKASLLLHLPSGKPLLFHAPRPPQRSKAILDGRQPGDLTVEKLLEQSRLSLAWHDPADRARLCLSPIRI